METLARMNAREFASHLPFSKDAFDMTFDGAMKADPTVFVAGLGEDLVGYLTARMVAYAAAAGFFTNQEVIYVRPDKRGTRAAVSLLRTFVEWSREIGAREAFMGTSTNFQPERTARLMEHVGARRVGYSLKMVL